MISEWHWTDTQKAKAWELPWPRRTRFSMHHADKLTRFGSLLSAWKIKPVSKWSSISNKRLRGGGGQWCNDTQAVYFKTSASLKFPTRKRKNDFLTMVWEAFWRAGSHLKHNMIFWWDCQNEMPLDFKKKKKGMLIYIETELSGIPGRAQDNNSLGNNSLVRKMAARSRIKGLRFPSTRESFCATFLKKRRAFSRSFCLVLFWLCICLQSLGPD